MHSLGRFLLLIALTFTVFVQADPSADPYACSASQPCKIGCCGKNNVCGLGPDYCSPSNCLNSCSAKSDCDPGWGPQWSNKESCPLNVCCSKYGFCGTTSEFCGDSKVKSPSCTGGNSAAQKVIGYYEGWSSTRVCKGLYPENLQFGAYTHLNYAFAFIDPNTFEVSNMQSSDSEFMPRLTALKNYNPGLEVWISIGGWSMNDPDQPTHSTFSDLAGSTANQQKFFQSLLSFMSTYGFDGVDIDWEYPVAPERSGKPADFANYVSFLKNLRGALGSNGNKYGLSITLPSSYWYMQNFDIKSIAPIIDWFNVMTYDLHGTWDSTDPYIGPIVQAHTNLTEIDQTMDLLWRNDIDPAKVVIGMGFYGRSFTLSNPSCSQPGCPFSAGGNPGPCSASAGTLMFSEIEDIIAAGATVVTDEAAAVKIVTWGGNQWVSYDDESTLKMKMDYANGKCLGGVMVWASSTDDSAGTAILALTGAAGRPELSMLSRSSTPDPGQCVWGECGASCPSGLVPVTSSTGNKDTLGIEAGCDNGSRFFCCPAKNPPTCEWKGSPKFCGLLSSRRCDDNQVEVAASTDGCWTGHKSLCCSKVGTDSRLSSCEWFGAAPICSSKSALTVALSIFGLGGPSLAASAFTFASYGCGGEKNYPIEQTTGKQGEGGQQSCSINGGFKSYCCSSPSPWKNCNWRTGNVRWTEWEQVLAGPVVNVFTSIQTDCKTGCDPGQVTVATDGFACRSGTFSYYCCDDPNGTPSPPSLPEISLCPGPAGLPGLTHEVEPGSPPNVFEEVDIFDDDCTLSDPYVSSPTKRDLNTGRDRIFPARPKYLHLFHNHTTQTPEAFAAGLGQLDSHVSEVDEGSTSSQLVRRGPSSVALKLCGPQGQTSSVSISNHPGASTLLRTGRLAYKVTQTGVCAVVGVSGITTLDPAIDWVTEHVLEKQEFRNALEWMSKGVTPLGNALRAGAAPFNSLFGSNGLFNTQWPQGLPTLSTVQSYGNVADTFTGLLGRTSDLGLNNANYDNLQICDADLNRYKEFVVAGVDFIGKANWAQYTDRLDRVGILTDLADSFGYRGITAVVQSYHTTYVNIGKLFGDFQTYAAQQGIQYNFADAWQQIITDGLNAQVQATRNVWLDYLNPELVWWTSTSAQLRYSPTIIKVIIDRLTDMSKNPSTYISLPVGKMTA